MYKYWVLLKCFHTHHQFGVLDKMLTKAESLQCNSPMYNATFSLHPSVSSVTAEGQSRYGFTWHIIWYNCTASAKGISHSRLKQKKSWRQMAEVPLPLQSPTLSYSPQLCWLQCNANQHLQKRERSCRGKAESGTGWATSTWGARSHKCEVIKVEMLFLKSMMHWLARTIPKLLTAQRAFSTRQ